MSQAQRNREQRKAAPHYRDHAAVVETGVVRRFTECLADGGLMRLFEILNCFEKDNCLQPCRLAKLEYPA
ncbi:MAG: hypothetical protein R3C59_30925 [Planctomycetaceae bacterium]